MYHSFLCMWVYSEWVSYSCTSYCYTKVGYIGLSMSENNSLLQSLGIKCFYISLACLVCFSLSGGGH